MRQIFVLEISRVTVYFSLDLPGGSSENFWFQTLSVVKTDVDYRSWVGVSGFDWHSLDLFFINCKTKTNGRNYRIFLQKVPSWDVRRVDTFYRGLGRLVENSSTLNMELGNRKWDSGLLHIFVKRNNSFVFLRLRTNINPNPHPSPFKIHR